MPISVQCDCGKKLKASDQMAGKKAHCPGCGQLVEIPAPEPAAEVEVAPAPRARPTRPRRGRRTSTAGMKQTEEAPKSPWWMWLIGPGVGGFGLLFTVVGFGMISKSDAAKSWPTIEGRIETSIIEEERLTEQRDGRTRTTTMYSAAIVFSYDVEGNRFQSDTISPGGRSSSNSKSDALDTVSKYPPGSTATVHYNPADPSEAFLEADAGIAPYIFIAFGILAMLIGGAVLFGLFRARKKATQAI